MAKSKFEMSQKLDLIGVIDKTEDGRLVFIVDDKDEIKEIDVFDIFERILGYNIKIIADLPIEV